ncbi:hypothetical protein Nepgr_032904 [Nepenthes gracilis]|uniref:Remorin C-terminal domain-containing protein n=1 Tax=Nepenthes gracilis TaxID=150966 RepID=A0AAD3TL00_NEPGR|nr:hypothetical protein Nepgr_032904 [Nepenthes gracilis]
MDYERIDKVETGIISPSKLRMKLIGGHQQKKKDGSNSNSSRTSPSKPEDSDFVKTSLLASKTEDYDEVQGFQSSSVKLCSQTVSTSVQNDQGHCSKENGDAVHVEAPQSSRNDGSYSSTIHLEKSLEDENLDYDSNASSSSFEFPKGERGVHKSLTQSLSRRTSYKWNEAEKWIMNKQSAPAKYSEGHSEQNGANCFPVMEITRVAPVAAANYENELITGAAETVSYQPKGGNTSIDLCHKNKELKEVGQMQNPIDEITGTPTIKTVSMRDTGTEMTPNTSQEPSRTPTPVGPMTPLQSPENSSPSTPRTGAPASRPINRDLDSDSHNPLMELSKQEHKLETRREIVALGVQLGKLNVAGWASKDEEDMSDLPADTATGQKELERIEFERRAALWVEAEKLKHDARFKREEIKIQAWESRQKAKLEAERKRMEAKVMQVRSYAEGKMKKKIGMERKKIKEKMAAAEARKIRRAEKTAAQAEYVRQTGRIPSSGRMCYGCFL